MNKLTKCLAALTACAGFSVIGVITACSSGKETKPTSTPHKHTYEESRWEKDENGHWYAANCGHNVKKSYALHVYDDDGDATCNVCGYERETEEEKEPPLEPSPIEPEKPTDPTPVEPETPEEPSTPVEPEKPIPPTEPEPTEPDNPAPEKPEPTEPEKPLPPTEPDPVIPEEPKNNNLLLDGEKISGLGGNIAERTVVCESESGNIFIASQTNFTVSAQATEPVTIDGETFGSAISAVYDGYDFEGFFGIGFEITAPATVTAYISASEFTEVSVIDESYFEEYEYVCEPQYLENACKITFTVTKSGTYYLYFTGGDAGISFNLHSLNIVFD